jgi:hypothetical protein
MKAVMQEMGRLPDRREMAAARPGLVCIATKARVGNVENPTIAAAILRRAAPAARIPALSG